MNHYLVAASGALVSMSILVSCLSAPAQISRPDSALGTTLLAAIPSSSRSNNVPVITSNSVSTIAGSGSLGIVDGPSLSAEFLMPVAVASSGGQLYIVDEAAQRIRKLANGIVTTVAGSGKDEKHIGHVVGAYRDGPALAASFNEPTAIAAGGDGALYITDELNHAIRKLFQGTVTTLVGGPDKGGDADGPLASASFKRPRAIAIATDGTIFVADFGVGVRQISRDGIVKTLPTPPSGSKQFVAIAVAGSGAAETILVTENNGLYYVIKPASGENAVYNGLEGGGFPRIFGLAAANPFEFVATDIQQNAVRLIRLSDKPEVTNNAGPIIAGSPTIESQNSGGYADGALFSAKFYSPLGIAIDKNTIIIADAGNRRIRSMPMPDIRRPIGSDVQQLTAQPGKYRILTIGASHSFWATDWTTSIPGLVEASLIKDQFRLGIKKPIQVIETRIDSAGLGTQAEYLTNFVGSGQVNLVVMMLTSADLESAHVVGNESSTAAAIRTLTELRKTLAASGTSLFVHVRPEYTVVSQIDDLYDRERVDNPQFDPTASINDITTNDEAILKASGVRFHLALSEYTKYEASVNKLPLWAFQDSHENLNGREFAAKNIFEQLELAHPWTSAP